MAQKPPNNGFDFTRDAVDVARNLIGCELCYHQEDQVYSGLIVETEAYTADDPASHSYKGRTLRNEAMFLPGGHIYMYRSYGIHLCFNLVTGKEGEGEAVLIRALEPRQGMELMKRNRGKQDELLLANGPGKLTQAMQMSMELCGLSLVKGKISIAKKEARRLGISPRVGISKATERLWRFYALDSPYLSRIKHP